MASIDRLGPHVMRSTDSHKVIVDFIPARPRNAAGRVQIVLACDGGGMDNIIPGVGEVAPETYVAYMAEHGTRAEAPSTHHATINGARNRVQGETLQSRLDDYHALLEAQGAIAGALRTDARAVQTGPTTARVIGKGWVDYVIFLKYGRSVHFDAKSTIDPQGYSVPTKSKHQVQRLRDMAAGQHIAGFVVEWLHHGVVCWHPISSVLGQRIKFADGIKLNDVEWMRVI